jgi:hypothetical protein
MYKVKARALKKDVLHAIAGSTLPALLLVGEGRHTYLYRPDLNPRSGWTEKTYS